MSCALLTTFFGLYPCLCLFMKKERSRENKGRHICERGGGGLVIIVKKTSGSLNKQ